MSTTKITEFFKKLNPEEGVSYSFITLIAQRELVRVFSTNQTADIIVLRNGAVFTSMGGGNRFKETPLSNEETM